MGGCMNSRMEWLVDVDINMLFFRVFFCFFRMLTHLSCLHKWDFGKTLTTQNCGAIVVFSVLAVFFARAEVFMARYVALMERSIARA